MAGVNLTQRWSTQITSSLVAGQLVRKVASTFQTDLNRLRQASRERARIHAQSARPLPLQSFHLILRSAKRQSHCLSSSLVEEGLSRQKSTRTTFTSSQRRMPNSASLHGKVGLCNLEWRKRQSRLSKWKPNSWPSLPQKLPERFSALRAISSRSQDISHKRRQEWFRFPPYRSSSQHHSDKTWQLP